jgi:hypothetical protein
MTTPEQRFMTLEASLKELARLGSPVDLEVAETRSQTRKVEIEQQGGLPDSMIFSLPDGRTGYIFDVSVTNQTSRVMYVADIDLLVPWEGGVEWLLPRTFTSRDRRNKTTTYELYEFPGKNGFEFDTDVVINHQLQEGKKLHPQRPVSGLLLAIGGMMPELFHGGWVRPTFVITTSDHADYRQELCLWTDHAESRTRAAKLAGGPHGGLFGGRAPRLRPQISNGIRYSRVFTRKVSDPGKYCRSGTCFAAWPRRNLKSATGLPAGRVTSEFAQRAAQGKGMLSYSCAMCSGRRH